MGCYEVEGFNEEALLKFIQKGNVSSTEEKVVRKDKHFKYLLDYLSDPAIGAKFILFENDYVSVDFLLDYSHYYSRSYANYSSKCSRIHFFSSDAKDAKTFQEDVEKSLLEGEKGKQGFWNEEYLGFIVIRPIPVFFLGYSILKHYNHAPKGLKKERVFWGTKPYKVHLLGKEIIVDSLGFISQDYNVAACATIAVWCMLQRAVEDYYINLKSPYEITLDAGLILEDGNRVMPSSGLDPISICATITKSNLKTLIFRYNEVKKVPKAKLFGRFSIGSKDSYDGPYSMQMIKEHLYAYSNMGLPIILGLEVPENKVYANHAIAVVGFSIDHSEDFIFRDYTKDIKGSGTIDFRHKAQRINKLYCHDDQFGPFAAVAIDDKKGHLITPWNTGIDALYPSKPTLIIVSVFEKIRIGYLDIRSASSDLNKFCGFVFKEMGLVATAVTWDIRLYLGHDFKKGILKEANEAKYSGKNLIKMLAKPLPKYVWVSEVLSEENESLGYFLFDGTGLRGTPLLIGWFSFISGLSEWMRDFYSLYKDEAHLADRHILLHDFDVKVMLFEGD